MVVVAVAVTIDPTIVVHSAVWWSLANGSHRIPFVLVVLAWVGATGTTVFDRRSCSLGIDVALFCKSGKAKHGFWLANNI